MKESHKRRLSVVMSDLGKRRAEAKKCPKCGRKGALKEPYVAVGKGIVTECRWEGCGYVNINEIFKG